MVELLKARRELDKAHGRLRRMSTSPSPDIAESLWIEALHCLERAHNKIEAQLKENSSFQGWPTRGKTLKLRRQDPLLAYLRHARGAEEHTLADLTREEPGSMTINPAKGNSLYIERLEVQGNRVHIDSPDNIEIKFNPTQLVMLAVTNRGRTYEPPTSHLGQELEEASPYQVALKGHEFYTAYVAEIEQQFANG